MRRAVELAAKGIGSTHPNPVVGSVITGPDGHPVGEGFHAVAGGPPAEFEALRMAGSPARGGTGYVTLEPRNHTRPAGPGARAPVAARVAPGGCARPGPHKNPP